MEQQPKNTKKWLWIVIVAAVLIIMGVVALLAFRTKPNQERTQTTAPATGPEHFVMSFEDRTVRYAGNPVYDACGLIAFDTFRTTVNNYQALLDMNGTDKKPSDSLTIEHRYIDRDIDTPLGKDSEPRPTGTKIDGSGQNVIDAGSFISESDSNCWYGQGRDLSLGIGKTFAKVYVTQKPTPLSGELLGYLASVGKAGSEGDVAAYVEPKTDAGGFFTSIVTNEKKGVAVFVKTSTKDLAQKATLEVSNKLSQDPTGPMNVTYPNGWSKMPNPCTLLTAEDFRHATGKPTGALAEDTLGLNEIGGSIMQRSCERLELERLDNTPIAKSNITIRMAKNEGAAKDYVNFLKNDKVDTFDILPLKQRIALADDAYLAGVKNGDKIGGYELHMRIGQAVIVLAIDTEAGVDTSADAFAARILPLAQKVAERYKK